MFTCVYCGGSESGPIYMYDNTEGAGDGKIAHPLCRARSKEGGGCVESLKRNHGWGGCERAFSLPLRSKVLRAVGHNLRWGTTVLHGARASYDGLKYPKLPRSRRSC